MAFYRQNARNRIQRSLKEHKTTDRGLRNSISKFLAPPRLAMFYSNFEINENYCSVGCSRNLRSEGNDNIMNHISGRGHEMTRKLPMSSLRVCWNSKTNGKMELSSKESEHYISTDSSDERRKTGKLFKEKPEKTTQKVKHDVRYNDLDDEKFETRFRFDSHTINYLNHIEINSIFTGLSNARGRSHHRNSVKHRKEKSSLPGLSDPSEIEKS